jgi:hypothetical protein
MSEMKYFDPEHVDSDQESVVQIGNTTHITTSNIQLDAKFLPYIIHRQILS